MNSFAGLVTLGCASGFATRFGDAVAELGWNDAAIATFDISAIVWIACCAGVLLIHRDRLGLVNKLDVTIGALFVVPIMLPITSFSWLAVSALCVYILNTTHGAAIRQGATIIFAVTVPMLWSRLLFDFFAGQILSADATLVSFVLGTKHTGNMVEFADHSGNLVVLPPCSSLANVSLVVSCWISVSELTAHKKSLTDIFWCVLACLSVILINVLRMSIMGRNEKLYYSIHNAFGNAVTSWIITAMTVIIYVLGVRRNIRIRI